MALMSRKFCSNVTLVFIALMLSTAALSCGENDDAIPLNEVLFGQYRRLTYVRSLDACSIPQFDLLRPLPNNFVQFFRAETSIGDYVGYRNCILLDDCAITDNELLFAELRNGDWLAKRRTAIQYSGSCALQFIQSTIELLEEDGSLLRIDTFYYSGVVDRPDGTSCDPAMAEEMFEQFDCVTHDDSLLAEQL